MGAFRYHWKSLRFYVGLSTGLVDRSEDVGAVVGVTWMKWSVIGLMLDARCWMLDAGCW